MDTPTIEELRLAAACCLSGDGTELERWQLAKVAEWLDDLADARELRDAVIEPMSHRTMI